MAYLHIDNLYKNQDILMYRECYALEKIHGTSAHVSFNNGAVGFFSGGEKREKFLACFDEVDLITRSKEQGLTKVIVYGEAYGGKQQGMRATYGDETRFVAFDVKIGDSWLSVPDAEQVVAGLGLEFVHYKKVSTDLSVLDTERDAPSVQAKRNGVGDDKPREGIVLRPLIEVIKNNGSRVISKHKGDEFRETTSKRKVINTDKIEILKHANEIADEWVTPMRLQHLLQKHEPRGDALDISDTGGIIKAMIEDVVREAGDEIIDSKEARTAIGRRAAMLFKRQVCVIKA